MPEDMALLARLKEALNKDKQLSRVHPHIHLRAIGGVVFLDGEVPTAAQSEQIEAVLKEVEGVRFVQNRLQVAAPDTPEDREAQQRPAQQGHRI